MTKFILWRFGRRHGCVVFNCDLTFTPQDMWVGLYWRRDRYVRDSLDMWICWVPCLPLHLSFTMIVGDRLTDAQLQYMRDNNRTAIIQIKG